MKTIISVVPLGVCALVGLAPSARADVSWQHSISVRSGQNIKAYTPPQFKMTLLNDWSGLRHRSLARFKSSDMKNFPMIPGSMMGKMPTMHALQSTLAPAAAQAAKAQANNAQPRGAYVDLAVIIDRDADRFAMYSSPQREYIQEPLSATLKRVRFDPWRKTAPRLSEEKPEALTPQQRERLGAEVRATYSPFIKKQAKFYFRPTTETRTVAGLQGRGYRMTVLVNTGTEKRPAWGQMRALWFVARELPGDEEIRTFQRSSHDLLQEIGGPSASMWLNEAWPVMYQMLPTELLQSIETITPPAGAPREFFAGTPLEMHLTILPPPLERRMTGEVRVDMLLEARSTGALADTMFQAPEGYKRIPLEPQLKKYDEAMGKIYQMQAQNPFAAPLLGLLPR